MHHAAKRRLAATHQSFRFLRSFSFVCTFDKNALGGTPVLLRTYRTASAAVDCTIWEAARATSAAPTFFPPIAFLSQPGVYYIDAGIGCNNPTQTLLNEARLYSRLRRTPLTFPTCLLSIGTGQKDLIQLQEATPIFWFKDRVGLSIATALANIATDCEKTHDAIERACIDSGTTDRYFRFNVVKGLQKVVLDEWNKAAEIKSSTDAYLRSSQVDEELLGCADILCAAPGQRNDRPAATGNSVDRTGMPRISQVGNVFKVSHVTGGRVFQGNFAGNTFNDFERRT